MSFRTPCLTGWQAQLQQTPAVVREGNLRCFSFNIVFPRRAIDAATIQRFIARVRSIFEDPPVAASGKTWRGWWVFEHFSPSMGEFHCPHVHGEIWTEISLTKGPRTDNDPPNRMTGAEYDVRDLMRDFRMTNLCNKSGPIIKEIVTPGQRVAWLRYCRKDRLQDQVARQTHGIDPVYVFGGLSLTDYYMLLSNANTEITWIS